MKKIFLIGSASTVEASLVTILAVAHNSFDVVSVVEKLSKEDLDSGDVVVTMGSVKAPEDTVLLECKNGLEMYKKLFPDTKVAPLILQTLHGKLPKDKESKERKKVEKSHLIALLKAKYNNFSESKVGEKNKTTWLRLLGPCLNNSEKNVQDVELYYELVAEGEDYIC
jgi:hypothetical protein